MERRRRIAAYGICRRDGQVLLVRAAPTSAMAGRWFLPGGGVEHGEHPADAVVREVREETGLSVVVQSLAEVVTDIDHLPDVPALRHHDRLIFNVEVTGGELANERHGSTDLAEWVSLAGVADRPLMPFVACALGVAPAGELVEDPAERGPGLTDTVVASGETVVVRRRQRFASYGLVTDPARRVLLALIAPGYPGAGHWHLPGGGTDFGEPAARGLLRELIEETDQRGRVVGLLGASHRHHRDALGPEGVPIDWHGVRVVYQVVVDEPSAPRVMEAHGSTQAAAWFTRSEALALPLTEIAQCVIADLPASC